MLLQEMTWPEIGNLSRDIPVLVPVAALEQHGRHMPVFTDSLLLGEVVRRVGEAMTDRVLIAPLMWLGNSHHHLDFQGTLSASPRVYLDLLNDLAENLIAHGFRRIVFVNGHGGNITPGEAGHLRAPAATSRSRAICCCCSASTGTKPTRTPAAPTWCSRRWVTPASGRRR